MIFVSYMREDKLRVEKLVGCFRACKLEVFWDPDLPIGGRWDDGIRDAIDRAEHVVVVWNEDSEKSDYQREEAKRAKDQKKLVPVRLEEVTPPWGFTLDHVCDLSGWDGEPNDRRLLGLIGTLGGDVHLLPPAPPASPWRLALKRSMRSSGVRVAAAVAFLVSLVSIASAFIGHDGTVVPEDPSNADNADNVTPPKALPSTDSPAPKTVTTPPTPTPTPTPTAPPPAPPTPTRPPPPPPKRCCDEKLLKLKPCPEPSCKDCGLIDCPK